MKRGFSLAEVVVSMFLLGLVLAAVLNLFPASMLALDTSQARYQAVELAQSRLERQAQIVGRGAWPEPAGSLPEEESRQPFSQSLGDQAFQGEVITERISECLRKVTAKVSWTSRGTVRTVEEVSYVSALRR